jgi:hypothetical protein
MGISELVALDFARCVGYPEFLTEDGMPWIVVVSLGQVETLFYMLQPWRLALKDRFFMQFSSSEITSTSFGMRLLISCALYGFIASPAAI